MKYCSICFGARRIFAKISLAPSRLLSSCSLKWSSLGPLTFQPIRKLFSAIDTFSFPFHFSLSVSGAASSRCTVLTGEKKFFFFLLLFPFSREEMLRSMHGGPTRSYYVISSLSVFPSLFLSLSFVPVRNNSVYLLFKFWPRFFPRAASRARQL